MRRHERPMTPQTDTGDGTTEVREHGRQRHEILEMSETVAWETGDPVDWRTRTHRHGRREIQSIWDLEDTED